MLSINELFTDPFLYALGWTVIHSFWQGSLLALLLYLLLHLFSIKSAALRYSLSYGGLVLMLWITIFTFWKVYLLAAANSAATPLPYSFTLIEYSENHSLQTITTWLDQHIYFISSTWIIGVACFILRFGIGITLVHRLKKSGQIVDTKWHEIIQQLSQRLQLGQSVQLKVSPLVQSPQVIGFFKPIVLFPIGVLNQLPTTEVEAILAHELAHILRNDYLFHIIQSLIEILFFFNPAVWWIVHRIRVEREHCCDDLAVAVTQDRVQYAKALHSVGLLQANSLALSMDFSSNKKPLLVRIQRVLRSSEHQSNTMEKLLITCLLVCGLFFLAGNLNSKASSVTAVQFFSQTGRDTIPVSDGKIEIIRTENDDKVRAIVEKGKITFLEINGTEIPESDYKKYESMIGRMLKAPEPPVAPSPPSPIEVPVPPAPPAPPSPPAAPKTGVTTSRSSNEVIEELMQQYHEEMQSMNELLTKKEMISTEALRQSVADLKSVQEEMASFKLEEQLIDSDILQEVQASKLKILTERNKELGTLNQLLQEKQSALQQLQQQALIVQESMEKLKSSIHEKE